ncbi:uncharacterized protein B0T15DRAFT_15310 [Chaetomium strumarium]|uniref:Zn(2)-C6 fungal-type domain-containing protein n=1 Tax=Chaetomium strumarium TaxID=1170767 RepID=A0AAJ0H0Y9_9PEZI|nr:hypothetical protein B0T15DRAFT_15310 [Chaetomium strumarium]
MDPQPDRDPPFSDSSTHVLPAHPAGFELALEAECKARLEEIEWQRDEESAAMRNRLYSLVMEYKRRDQSFVDRYTECLEQLTRRLPVVANTSPWAKPCRGVAEWETFYRGGIAIRFYPSTGSSLLVPHGDNAGGETVTPRKFPSNIATTSAKYPPYEFSPSSSPLSSVPCSPEPVSRLAPDTREARPRKQLKRPLSPDELAFGSSSSPPGAAGQKTTSCHIPQQEPGCELLSTHDQKQSTQSTKTNQRASTPTQQPPSVFSAPLPCLKVDRRVPCLECRRRRVKCSRGRPRCRECKRQGNLCRYPLPSPTRTSRQDFERPPSVSMASLSSKK